jgi:hypothetical protein
MIGKNELKNRALTSQTTRPESESDHCPRFLHHPRRPRSTFIALGVVQRVGGEA